MKALSFLGTGDYKEATYVWQDADGVREGTTHLFPEAVFRIFAPEKLLVFVTPQVKAHENFRTLCERLENKVSPVDIPEGKSEAELWQIFDKCTEVVDDGDEVLLDITHAFRSLPLIVFAVAAYLRRTKGVTIRHIVYGAFEARDEQNRAPIFDLTPLLDLLDWLSGAEFLLRRSDATLLAERLKQIHQTASHQRTNADLPTQLQSLGNALVNFSQALHLARPRDIMSRAHGLCGSLTKVTPEIERWAKPFGVILEKVRAEAEKLAHDAPDRLDAENLRKQLTLIEHFVEKGLFVQAILLAREWVVSWVALQRGEGDWLDKQCREEELERALNTASLQLLSREDAPTQLPEWFEKMPQRQTVAQLWDWLRQLRNDIAHCGFRKGAAGINSIQQRAKEISQRLQELLNDVPNRVMIGGRVVIDLKTLYGEVAKLDDLPFYLERAKELAGEGNEVVLTGQAPIWLYLAIAHALHGKARRLLHSSPTTGEVLIFDHSAR